MHHRGLKWLFEMGLFAEYDESHNIVTEAMKRMVSEKSKSSTANKRKKASQENKKAEMKTRTITQCFQWKASTSRADEGQPSSSTTSCYVKPDSDEEGSLSSTSSTLSLSSDEE